MTGTSSLGNVAFTGAGTKTFANNASTSDLTINPGATVVAPASLALNGTLSNSGTFTHNGGTLFMTDGAVASGTLTGTSALNNVTVVGTSTGTFQSNASTTNLTVNTGATVVAPARLTVSGNLVNSGTYDTGVGKQWASWHCSSDRIYGGSVAYGNGKVCRGI